MKTRAKRYRKDYRCRECGTTDPKRFYVKNHQWCRKCQADRAKNTRTARKDLGLCTTCGKHPRGKTMECDRCRDHQLKVAKERRARLAAKRERKKVKREGVTALGTSEATRIVTLLEVRTLWNHSHRNSDFSNALSMLINDVIITLRARARKTDAPQDYVMAIPLVKDRGWEPGVLLKSHRWATLQRLAAVLPEVVIIKVEDGHRSKDYRVVDVLPADAKEVLSE